MHTCVINEGGVQCWGENESGQLGNDSTTNLWGDCNCRQCETCAVVNGTARCRGSNAYGELGNNSVGDQWVPWMFNSRNERRRESIGLVPAQTELDVDGACHTLCFPVSRVRTSRSRLDNNGPLT